MTATTVYNTQFFDSTTGHPLYGSGYPRRRLPGGTTVPFSYTIATTSSDEAADRVRLVPLPDGAKNLMVHFNCGDLDTSTGLDADLVLREDATDTVIYNAGAGFQSAHAGKLVVTQEVVSEGDGIDASVDFLVNVAGTTPAEGTIEGYVWYE